MCGRFGMNMTAAEIAKIFGTSNPLPNFPANYNASPTQNLPVVHEADGQRIIGIYRWGLVPSWAKDLSIGIRAINARAEGIESKPMFKAAFKSRRCLVPASVFFEWTGKKGQKQPHAIALKNNEPMAFAGLWESWKEPKTGELLRTFSIITGEPNELVKPIHDRMPVIIHPSNWDQWLKHNESTEELKNLLVPYPESEMMEWEISPAINTVRNNHCELWNPMNSA